VLKSEGSGVLRPAQAEHFVLITQPEGDTMDASIPEKMEAVAIDRYGGPEVLQRKTLPVPRPKADQVLIQVQSAGIGAWDPAAREGEFEVGEGFPRILGNDGAGLVVATGEGVKRFRVGDAVYANAFEGGFYAEYAAVKENEVSPLPTGLPLEDAGVLGADGATALVGLEDTLKLRPGETLLVFGASGGIGHIAVQLAKRIGARVLAVASGEDGVALARKLGADEVVEGHRRDLLSALRRLAPEGVDAALVLAGKGAARAIKVLKDGGRIAYPNGVEPEPKAPEGVTAEGYDGRSEPDVFERLNRLIGSGPFHVEIASSYRFEQIAEAHRALNKHHLGKLALRIRPS
jgi:NADPH2:quinone reductase